VNKTKVLLIAFAVILICVLSLGVSKLLKSDSTTPINLTLSQDENTVNFPAFQHKKQYYADSQSLALLNINANSVKGISTFKDEKYNLTFPVGKQPFTVISRKKENTLYPLETLLKSFGYALTGSTISMTEAEIKKREQGKKVIYLTFDDGPGAETTKLLDILSQYHAKATFFLLDKNIKKHAGIINETVKRGHAVGSHGVTHQIAFYDSADSAVGEMQTTADTIATETGVQTKLIRTPFGSKPNLTKDEYKALLDNKFILWDWNVDSNDWAHPKDPKLVAKETIEGIEKMETWDRTPVVVMHDHGVTLEALPEILQYLKDHNYLMKKITAEIKPTNFWTE
jgi:peptidoglycan/xylan/chitin deacetylase (PgdA/CDA1 family)